MTDLERSPFPVPFGWFGIGYPEDFPAGQPKAIFYFDRHLVAWRDETGELHVQDPFCGEIEWLSDIEVAGGFADGSFRPAVTVSRQAMAGFMNRLDLADVEM
jgi:hypothetical protein